MTLKQGIRLAGVLLFLPLLGVDACPGPEPDFEVVAHRGFSTVAPENTMAAFDAAAAVGAHQIELDIRRTGDGAIVCLHDDTLDRTTDCSGSLASYTLAQLATCDAGSWFDPAFAGEPVPLLADVLDRFEGSSVGLYVEIKTGGLEQDLVDLIASRNAFDRVTVISFDTGYLDNVRAALAPGEYLPTSWLSSTSDTAVLDQAVAHGFDGVSLKASTVTRSIVSAAHDRELDVNVWTVNSLIGITGAANKGVDAITTDRPDRALDVLASDGVPQVPDR